MGQCQSITKKGTQCSRRAFLGGQYCWQHESTVVKWAKSITLGTVLVLISLIADLMGIFNFITTKVAYGPASPSLSELVSATTTAIQSLASATNTKTLVTEEVPARVGASPSFVNATSENKETSKAEIALTPERTLSVSPSPTSESESVEVIEDDISVYLVTTGEGLDPNKIYRQVLTNSFPKHIYSLKASRRAVVTILIEPTDKLDPVLEIYGDEGQLTALVDDQMIFEPETYELEFVELQYTLIIRGFAGSIGGYEISILHEN
jgi:hypothetical protein